MSRRTKDNKKKSFLRKAQARARVGTYYVMYNESSKSGKEYINPKAQRGLRLPKIINTHFQGILNKLLGRDKVSDVGGI